jgi:hypothetical protein
MTTISDVVANNPWLASLTLALIVIILLLPYHLEEWLDRRGRPHGVWKSLLWSWKFGPTYERLHIDGLHRLQRVLLKLLSDVCVLPRGDLLRRAVDELKRRLGL